MSRQFGEVANFCRDGYFSRHNTSYWKNIPYLGIGPGAHSYNSVSRQFNIPNNPKYIKSIASGVVPYEKEVLDLEAKTNEYLLTSLRTKWGCDLDVLTSDYHYDLKSGHEEEIKKFLDQGLIFIENNTLFLTKQGILLADEIIGQLFRD